MNAFSTMVRTSTDEAAVSSKLLSAIKAGEYVEGKTRSSDDRPHHRRERFHLRYITVTHRCR